MHILGIFRKFIGFFTKRIQAIFRRMARKNKATRSTPLGSPQAAATAIMVAIFGFLVTMLAVWFMKSGEIMNWAGVIDRETAPGVHAPAENNQTLDTDVPFSTVAKFATSETKIDCERIMTSLKTKGRISSQDRDNYDLFCRKALAPDVADAIDKALSEELPPTAMRDVMNKLTPENAKDIKNALANKDFVDALRSDRGSAIARDIDSLGKMNQDDLSRAANLLMATPPQHQEAMAKLLRETARLSSPEARSAMLGAAEKLKGAPGDFEDATRMARALQKATAEEQATLARAYERAPTRAARRSLVEATEQIVEMPGDSAVRKKLIETVKDISEMSPEDQEKHYQALAKAAKAYNEEKDPALKKALGDALKDAKSAEDVRAIAERFDEVKKAEARGLAIDRADVGSILTGEDPERLERIKAANAFAEMGKMDDAKRAMAGKVRPEEVREAIERRDAKNALFGEKTEGGAASDKPVTKDDILNLKRQRTDVKEKIRVVEAQIETLLSSGTSRTAREVVDLYKLLDELQNKEASYNAAIAAGLAKLRERVKDLNAKIRSEFGDANLVLPDFEGDDSEDQVSLPPARLSNLIENEDFWMSDREKEDRRRYFRFKDRGTNAVESKLLTKGGQSWFIQPSQGASSAQGTGENVLELMPGQTFPGTVEGIPSTGISTTKGGDTLIRFRFLGNVFSRKTGRLAIPQGSVAICKVKGIDEETTRLSADCNAVDVGSAKAVRVNFTLGDAEGASGLPGELTDNRGYYIASIFLTSFAASLLEGVSDSVLQPVKEKAKKQTPDYIVIGGTQGTTNAMQMVAQKKADQWARSAAFWKVWNGYPASVIQK